MPDERATSADRVTALETALTGFAERKTDTVVTPSVGLTFYSINEAYDFYNLYSWETGFGIRYAKSRTNVKGTRCMQEFVCCCSVSNHNIMLILASCLERSDRSLTSFCFFDKIRASQKRRTQHQHGVNAKL